MNIKTFDDVLSDDLLELVQIELNLFMYVKHTSTEGADNYFFASDIALCKTCQQFRKETLT